MSPFCNCSWCTGSTLFCCRNVITQGSSAGTDARRDYTCTRGRSATLLLKDNAALEGVILNNVFPTYMKKHHIDWMKQVQATCLDAQEVSLVLVRGIVKTTQRTVATFQNTEKSVSGNVQGAFLSTRNIEFAGDANANCVEYHSGARAVRDDHPSSPTPSSTAVCFNAIELTSSPLMDQLISTHRCLW